MRFVAFTTLCPLLETLTVRYMLWIEADGMPHAPAPFRLRRLQLYTGVFEAASFIWLCLPSVDHIVLIMAT